MRLFLLAFASGHLSNVVSHVSVGQVYCLTDDSSLPVVRQLQTLPEANICGHMHHVTL